MREVIDSNVQERVCVCERENRYIRKERESFVKKQRYHLEKKRQKISYIKANVIHSKIMLLEPAKLKAPAPGKRNLVVSLSTRGKDTV